jgi:hypothetical protein
MDIEDLNKDNRDQLNSTIKEKLLGNLQWSMLFFIFNRMGARNSSTDFPKEFFKGWKKFAAQNLIKKDLQTINDVLNSPKNIFHSLLQNKHEIIESTEIYQEKYNQIMKEIESFYFKSIRTQSEEGEE